jgi:hypothetical protein
MAASLVAALLPGVGHYPASGFIHLDSGRVPVLPVVLKEIRVADRHVLDRSDLGDNDHRRRRRESDTDIDLYLSSAGLTRTETRRTTMNTT